MGGRTSKGWRAAAVAALVVGGLAGCDGDEGDTEGDAGSLGAALDRLIDESGVASISVGVLVDGAPAAVIARGSADIDEDRAATPETIYGLASCSKPIVGLAAALLVDEVPEVDLDGDVNAWLDWDPPLAHPDHPDAPITLRMLLRHTSGIAENGPADYDDYPKPDPDTPLADFLRPLLSSPAYWLSAPGAEDHYSNLGIALAGLVIEQAAGVDFRAYCETRIFDPLGMRDTRWFYADLDGEQRARHAIPYDEGGDAYEIYGFNDYPSGLLRSTAVDMLRLMAALAGGGRLEGEQVLPASAVRRFHDGALSIDSEDLGGGVRGFEHSGGESGITTFFGYRTDGSGYVYLVNTDLDDDATDAFEGELSEILEEAAGWR